MSHLGTVREYAQRVPKSKYTPPTAEVAQHVEHVVALFRQIQQAETEYRKALVHLASAEGDGVPVAYIADQLGIERKTVYRHLGRSMT